MLDRIIAQFRVQNNLCNRINNLEVDAMKLAVVKVCSKRGIRLTAYHYNPKYRMYTKQEVL